MKIIIVFLIITFASVAFSLNYECDNLDNLNTEKCIIGQYIAEKCTNLTFKEINKMSLLTCIRTRDEYISEIEKCSQLCSIAKYLCLECSINLYNKVSNCIFLEDNDKKVIKEITTTFYQSKSSINSTQACCTNGKCPWKSPADYCSICCPDGKAAVCGCEAGCRCV